MNSPLVSIIMPAYNAEAFISQAVNSVLVQSYLNWELIIVNDGSTDNTELVIETFRQSEPRIKTIYQKNGKPAKARNAGIAEAKGEFLAFLDADDLWLPHRLEIGMLHFNSHVFDLFFSDSYITTDKRKEPPIENNTLGVKDKIYEGPYALKQFLESNKIPTLSVIVKKTCVERVNGFDETIATAEDYDLWIRLIKANCRFLAISTPLCIYRIQENSTTANDRLATNNVLHVLMKNYSKKDIVELRAYGELKGWLIRGLELYLQHQISKKTIITFLKHFEIFGKKAKIIFLLQPFLSQKQNKINIQRLI